MTGDRSLRQYDSDSERAESIDDPLIFLAQPDSIMVSKAFADRNRLRTGSKLTLDTAAGARAFTVRGLLNSSRLADAFGGSLAVMDIYAAQKMFGRGRTFDRIDVAKKVDRSLADSRAELQSMLGPGYDVDAPAGRGAQAESMLAGYNVMVNISSAFALFIGMFIVYNAFSIAVTQRRSEIGILRALGAPRQQIRALFLGESAVIGCVGSLVGALAGALIAGGIASAISTLVGDVYGVARQAIQIGLTPQVLLGAIAIGIVTSLVSAMVPAYAAASVDPVDALKKGSHELLSPRENRARVLLAMVFGLAAWLALAFPGSRQRFYAGYASAIVAALLLAPMAAVAVTKLLRPLLQRVRPIEGALAADSVIRSPRRTAVTVAALMLSLALVLAFAGMARATYSSIIDWLDTSLNADLFVMPSQRLDVRSTRFPSSMAAELASIEGVARVQMFRNGRIVFRGAPAMLAAVEMTSVSATNHRAPVAGDRDTMYAQAAEGKGVLVSDSLARLRRLSLGDVVEVAAPRGTLKLPIVGIVLDYTDQQGTIFIDRSVFTQYWDDDGVSDFRLFVTPGASIGEVARRISARYAGHRTLFVLTNEESRRYILRLTNQWFSLMNVQIAIAVLVAILGIVNTLTVSITDRRRELGVLQAVGALRTQIRHTIWIEAVTIGILGLALGTALGAVNLYYMLEVVQRDIAGLRLAYDFPFPTVLLLIPLMLVAAFVAALWPAESAIRGSLVEALEYE